MGGKHNKIVEGLEMKIYVAGGICSGKSTLARKIAEHTGYPLISSGGIIREYLAENSLLVTRHNLQRIGQELLSKLGYKGFLEWLIEYSCKARNVQWDNSLIFDGLRHGETYKCLQERFSGGVLIYCVCSQEIRLQRLIARDKIGESEAQRILSHETEKYVSGLESQAHLLFHPGSSFDDFLKQVDALTG